MSNKGEIRCFCGRTPLLAMYGVGADGKPYIHMRVYKQSRIYGEMFVSADAEVRIRCRECLRLQRIRIISGRPRLEEDRGLSSVGFDAGSVAPFGGDDLG